MSKRILFTFDKKTLKSLKDLMKSGKFDSLAEAVRHCVNQTAQIEEHKKTGTVSVVKETKEGEKFLLLID